MLTSPKTSARASAIGIAAIITVILLPCTPAASAQTFESKQAVVPCVGVSQILDLDHYLSASSGAPDAYDRIVSTAFGGANAGLIRMMAYEENRWFIYAAAQIPTGIRTTSDERKPANGASWVRRLIILNPSTAIVDDELIAPASAGVVRMGCLSSPTAPSLGGREAQIRDAAGEVSAQILNPKTAVYHVMRGGAQNAFVLEPSPEPVAPGSRTLQLISTSTDAHSRPTVTSELTTARDPWQLTVATGGRVYQLTLPPPAQAAGEISIAAVDGKTLLAGRPLPWGILPHGANGNRLLELWDSDYRGSTPAPWDIGRPADELQKLVTDGTVRRCRAIDMCCGSGTDAIYLAAKGFDVTAIDVAPTALSQARQKARQAGVTVHWALADILAPPDFEPFDFIYDRGCYHVVRDQNLAAYLETVRKYSHPGTQFLLLAARRAEQGGEEPSGVSEDELRFDFLNLFDVEWMREIRLQSNRPGTGPPGWSVFMHRNTAGTEGR